MKALTFRKVNELCYEEVPDPAILQPTDAIVEVDVCGVCGSDLHVLEGRELGIDSGTVFGHEFSGRVVETGTDVKRFTAGDRVCGPFTTNCGQCDACASGLTSRCRHGELFGWVSQGRGLHGTHAELLRVPFADATLFALPSSLATEDGVLLGDNLATAFYCVEQAQLAPDQPCVILGCGTVGVLTVAVARMMGIESIIAVDNVTWRRKRAESLGASVSCEVAAARDVVSEQTGGRGVAAVLEAVGSPANQLAFDLVRPGGTISSVGVPTDEHFAFSPVAAYDKNITLKIGRCPARAYMDQIIPWLDDRKLDLAPIYTHQLALSDGAEAYRLFASRADGVGKIILSCTS